MCQNVPSAGVFAWPSKTVVPAGARTSAAAGALAVAAALLTGPSAAAAPEHSAHGTGRAAGGAGPLLFQLQGSGGPGG